MNRRATKWLFGFMAVLLLVPSLVLGQGFQVGSIQAEVKDESGGALPGVTITARSQDRGTERTAVTDANGKATIPGLGLGRYNVTASLSGFKDSTATDVVVNAEKTTDVELTMGMGGVEMTITVTGEQPVVDRTNVSANTQLSTREYEKMPVGRSYQSLLALAPGVVDQPGNASSGNPQVHGALNTGNVYMFDGVDTTDTTTGTFGSNLNFEAVQEISVQTAGMSAEYGRATGAIMNVITKSGTNRFEGSFKSIQTNDAWNAPNKTFNQVTGASLARNRTDKNNYRYSATLGGPIWVDRIWFFGAYEWAKTVTAAAQTTVSNENYSASQQIKLPNYRLTAQITPTQTVFGKYAEDPFTGIIRDYVGAAPELFSLTAQDQGGDQWTVQYSGVFGSSITADAMYAENTSTITVAPYIVSPLHNGAPHFNQADGKYYNGGAFDGFVSRPREQAVVAASYLTNFLNIDHNFKAGVDWQRMKSSNFFAWPNSQLFIDSAFDWRTRTFTPLARRDYIDAPSTSEGEVTAFYIRDKMDIRNRLFVEAGLRYEMEEGHSDLGEKVVDTSTIAPRFQFSYDLMGNGNTLLTGTLGRFYQVIIQDFADDYAGTPQQANFDEFLWNAASNAYVFNRSVRAGGTSLLPNLGLDPVHHDEITLGVQRQFGPTMGAGVRYIRRDWDNFIDDIVTMSTTGATSFDYVNLDSAERTYNGLEFTFEKRFSRNWNLLANYTYSRTRGNHFGTLSTPLGNYEGLTCRTTVDPTIGTNGDIPCSEVVSPDRQYGNPSYDIPHLVNVLGGYTFELGPVRMTAGSAFRWSSGNGYSKSRTVNVVRPGSNVATSTGLTYLYEGLGSDRGSNYYTLDTSLEATYRIFGVDIGAKGEVFNITDQQEPVVVSNTAFCGNASAAAGTTCATARSTFGTYTARGSFQAPRSFRLTALIRF